MGANVKRLKKGSSRHGRQRWRGEGGVLLFVHSTNQQTISINYQIKVSNPCSVFLDDGVICVKISLHLSVILLAWTLGTRIPTVSTPDNIYALADSHNELLSKPSAIQSCSHVIPSQVSKKASH